MPRNADIDAILKDAGQDITAKPDKDSGRGGASATTLLPPDEGSDALARGGRGEKGWGETIAGIPKAAAKGAVGGVLGAAQGIDRLLPGSTIRDLISENTGLSGLVQGAREWADKPEDTWSESAAHMAGEIAPFAFQPELGLEAGLEGLATRAAGKYMLPVRGAGGRMAVNPWKGAAQKGIDWAKTAGRGAEKALPSAEAGISQDPEHPATAGTVGAITGAALPGVAGKVVGSKLAQDIAAKTAGHKLAGTALGAVGYSQFGPAGLAFWPAYVFLQGQMKRSGHWVADRAGKVWGFLPEGAQQIIRLGGKSALGAGGGEASKSLHGGQADPSAPPQTQ